MLNGAMLNGAMLLGATVAAGAPEPARALPPPPQPAAMIKTGYKVVEIAKD